MRHHRAHRKFGLERNARAAFIRSLASALILRGKIQTTIARAKEVRPFVERLVTKGKTDSLASRRTVAERLGGAPRAVEKIFKDIAPRYQSRAGGYTRITRVGRGTTDARALAQIEFV